ncbi:F510_1955 family glycosylhydrolase [Litchfieldia alkalitelluris]|uniref:F510_1955 family glycosylhydrolase n=1 Tax=Litchfieldia alkalitelluris TaxID=304268 RepID=UPI0009983E11|nr:hypothetical protein [Litchfieldia alkalitelluris]
MKKIGLIVVLLSIILAACSQTEDEVKLVGEPSVDTNTSDTVKVDEFSSVIEKGEFYKENDSEVINHIHGAGFIAGSDALFVATHHGLKAFLDGKWYETISDKHDYMGFQPTNDGFFASGHPEEGSKLSNPFGLIKSQDYGQTLEQLAFYGESDFHYLAAGYNSHVVYVINEHENSTLDRGLFYSLDQGQSWEKSKISGIPNAGISNIAAHLTEASTIAIGTEVGLYLSKNNGDVFELFSEEVNVTALAFTDTEVYFSTAENELIKQSLNTNENESIELPSFENGDMVMYIAISPNNRDELVIVTSKSNIYRTTDHGNQWDQL